jgi:hypothetical protein
MEVKYYSGNTKFLVSVDCIIIGSLRKQISAIENKNITPAEPVEPASISPEKIQSMTDEQYQEYKEKQRTNYSQVEKGSGSKLREMFGNIGKID